LAASGGCKFVTTSRKLIAVGTLFGAVALARLGASLRSSFAAHPTETEQLFRRFGYSAQPNDSEMLIVGYRYALLRRPFAELEGTAVERDRNRLLIWFALLFTGLTIGLVGLALAATGE
jgi:hypothetical protein